MRRSEALSQRAKRRTTWRRGRDQRAKDVLIIFGKCNIGSRQLFHGCVLSLLEFRTVIEKICECLFAATLTNLSGLQPNPVQYALFSNHPSTPERIGLARDWAKQHGVAVPPPRVGASG